MYIIYALDVTALYPSIRQDLLIIALDHALTSLGYSENRKMMITELTKFCSQNSTVCYRGQWYKLLLGIPTGGPETGCLANIFL